MNHDDWEDWKDRVTLDMVDHITRIKQLEEDIDLLIDTVLYLANRIAPDIIEEIENEEGE